MQSGTLVFSVDANEGAARTGKATVKDNEGKVEPITLTFEQDPFIAVSSVLVTPESAELEVGETLTLTVTVLPAEATDKTVRWATDNESVATVSEEGVVSAKAEGMATITAMAGEKAASCEITVKSSGYKRVRGILMELYKALDGPNWKKQENWGTDADLRKWAGVSISAAPNQYGFTISLIFNNMGLKGEIPACIGDLGDILSVFSIYAEPGVTGTFPVSFSKLVNLESLYIQGTSLTSLPDIFTDLTKLSSVVFSNNPHLTGPLPESLGSSPVLSTFSISSNTFTGGIPESWVRLVDFMYVGNNCLTGKVAPFFQNDDEAKKFVSNGNLWQKDGYGFDISEVEIPGNNCWPENVNGGQKMVQDLNGNTFSFEDVIKKNRYTVYISWSPWDPYSRRMMPELKNLYDSCHHDGLEIIATVQLDKDGDPWKDNDAQRKAAQDRGFDQWYNFSWWDVSKGMAFLNAVPTAEVYDSNGHILFSSFNSYPDPVRNRFGKTASQDLIPFLERLLSPEIYTSKDYSKDGEVLTLQTATKGKGINVVFIGDAYTDRDMESGGRYETVMNQSMEAFFAIEPYKSFRDRFNVYAVKVVSPNGKVGSGYSTALETSFGYGSEIYCNTDKSEGYALKVPSITSTENLLTFVIVNDPDYKGMALMSRSMLSGIAFVTTEGNDPDWFGNTIRHESGHAFGFLADEYASYEELIPASKMEEYTDLYNQFGWYSNVDFTNDPEKVHWSAFLSDDRYKNETGIYEGGFYYTKGVFRPSDNSMMRDNLEYFNAPSRWAIYKRIMELSGETASFDKFLEYDAVNRGKAKASAARPPLKSAANRPVKHSAPPVVVP